jgi:hypothetical protein
MFKPITLMQHIEPFVILLKKGEEEIRVGVVPRIDNNDKSSFELIIQDLIAGTISCNNGRWESEDISDTSFIKLMGKYIEKVSKLLEKKDAMNFRYSFSEN